jgi:hypothetical protein
VITKGRPACEAVADSGKARIASKSRWAMATLMPWAKLWTM